MRGRKRVEIPGELLRLERRFFSWREIRVKGERIPSQYWESAGKLASKHGVCQTAKVLKLDYYSLKKQMEQQSAEPSPVPAFIELPSPSTDQSSECVIEFENKSGDRMRVHLKDSTAPDLITLGRSFWGID
jgi:hypothetical protein